MVTVCRSDGPCHADSVRLWYSTCQVELEDSRYRLAAARLQTAKETMCLTAKLGVIREASCLRECEYACRE